MLKGGGVGASGARGDAPELAALTAAVARLADQMAAGFAKLDKRCDALSAQLTLS